MYLWGTYGDDNRLERCPVHRPIVTVRSTLNLQLFRDSEADPKHQFKMANQHMAQVLPRLNVSAVDVARAFNAIRNTVNGAIYRLRLGV